MSYDGRLALRVLKSNIAAMSKGVPPAVWAASQPWADGERVVTTLKANVGASDVDAGYTVRANEVDFQDAVRQVSIIDRIGAKRLPPFTRLLGLDSIVISAFVREGKAIPVSRSDMNGEALVPAKVGGIGVVSTEAFDSEDLDVERALVDALAAGLGVMIDAALLNPDGDGSDGNPASITNGADSFPSSGSSLANIDADIQRAVDRLVSHGSNLLNARWVLRPETATYLATLRGTSGAPAYPGIGAKGGELAGLPALTSAGVPTDGASPAGSLIALIDGDAVSYTDAGAEMARSTTAMLEMSSEPAGDTLTPAAATQVRISTFQDECTAIKVVRRINWKRRNDRIVVITDVGF